MVGRLILGECGRSGFCGYGDCSKRPDDGYGHPWQWASLSGVHCAHLCQRDDHHGLHRQLYAKWFYRVGDGNGHIVTPCCDRTF